MKTLIQILTFIFTLATINVIAQKGLMPNETNISMSENVNIDLSIEFKDCKKSDSVYVMFYPINVGQIGNPHYNPYKFFVFDKLINSIQISPGRYNLCVMSHTTKMLRTAILIPPFNDLTMELTLFPQIIGMNGINQIEQIKEVTIRGDFNNFLPQNEVQLDRFNDIWKVDKLPENIKAGQCYMFYINGQETIDLLNYKIQPNKNWATINNVIVNNELIFNPSLYALEYRDSQLKVSWQNLQDQYIQVINEVRDLKGSLQKQKKINYTDKIVRPYLDMYSQIEMKYDPFFKQYILINKLQIIDDLLSIKLNEPFLTTKSPAFKDFCKSVEVKDLMIEIMNIQDQLDPTSIFQDNLNLFIELDNVLAYNSKQYGENEISTRHFMNYFKKYATKMTNEEKAINHVYRTVDFYGFLVSKGYFGEDEKKIALELIDFLKSNFNYEKVISNESIEQVIEMLNPKPLFESIEDSYENGENCIVVKKNYMEKEFSTNITGEWQAAEFYVHGDNLLGDRRFYFSFQPNGSVSVEEPDRAWKSDGKWNLGKDENTIFLKMDKDENSFAGRYDFLKDNLIISGRGLVDPNEYICIILKKNSF